MEAIVTDIQRFSLDDGPGIRTTVFFKGCPLACAWCHNPECISPLPQLRFSEALCAGCGTCASVCKNGVFPSSGGHGVDFKKCTVCGACAGRCPTRALTMAGETHTIETLMGELMKDAAFYKNSGGGVTLSGGEPLLRAPFVSALARALQQEGVPVAVDTCGEVPFHAFEALLPYAGLFLYDLKAYSPGLHTALTGKGNARILENFRKLQETGARIWVRIPLVAGVNDAPEEVSGLAELLRDFPVEQTELLPYHKYGVSKYAAFGLPYAGGEFSAPDAAHLEALARLFPGRVSVKEQ